MIIICVNMINNDYCLELCVRFWKRVSRWWAMPILQTLGQHALNMRVCMGQIKKSVDLCLSYCYVD